VNAVPRLHVEPTALLPVGESNPERGVWLLRTEHAPQLPVDEQVDGTSKHAVDDTGSCRPQIDLATHGQSF
jgi:hypothetical protein